MAFPSIYLRLGLAHSEVCQSELLLSAWHWLHYAAAENVLHWLVWRWPVYAGGFLVLVDPCGTPAAAASMPRLNACRLLPIRNLSLVLLHLLQCALLMASCVALPPCALAALFVHARTEAAGYHTCLLLLTLFEPCSFDARSTTHPRVHTWHAQSSAAGPPIPAVRSI